MACARVAHLIDAEGFVPNSIWMISATPAAVPEIRDWIAFYLEDPADADAVKLATLASHAWTVQSGFDLENGIFGSDNDNIERMRDRVRQDQAVTECLDSVDHLVVDDAQGLVGIYADLIIQMIRKLHEECGVTVFADEAEAVDGFDDHQEKRSGATREPSLSQRIRDREVGLFKKTQVATGTGNTGSGPSPAAEAIPPRGMDWDRSQLAVIRSPRGKRLIVSAGPGTGKTAVACARVAHLIDAEGLEADSIWMISFTRAAVGEIRDRIAGSLKDPAHGDAVKLATLDSHAWAIQSGFDEEARILGSYDDNIERMCALVRQDEAVAEYLETVGHLVVDEAQDLVGIRANLVIEIICKLRKGCGVTVFADEAQAIYGFSDDREVQCGATREAPLPHRIRRGEAGAFDELELTEVHRTDSRNLLSIFRDTRRTVLATATGTGDELERIRSDVRNLAHGTAPSADDPALGELEDAFILYRRRCDVLLATSFMSHKSIPHRVQMSGLPVCLVPWIGGALSEHTAPDLSKDAFRQLWADRVCATALATCQPDEAWEQLVRVAGRTRSVVDMRQLRLRLGRKQPPAEVCLAELGDRGPVVGTIHASKGREADTVHLMLAPSAGSEVDQMEEARVVFVGATRARSKLFVGRGYSQRARRVEASGRAYSLKTRDKRPRAQVEIGHDNDIDAVGLAGRCYFDDTGQVRTSQARIRDLAGKPAQFEAKTNRNAKSNKFAYRLREKGKPGQCLAVLSERVNKDLFEIAKVVESRVDGNLRLPDSIWHLSLLGVRTIVVPPDAPEIERLHEPWGTSGILLAPLAIGYTTLFFPRRGWR